MTNTMIALLLSVFVLLVLGDQGISRLARIIFVDFDILCAYFNNIVVTVYP